jgi:hypothetical protein
MDYSLKLKSVMEQIKILLKENDIAGFVVLHCPPNYSEYLNYISPSYSCAKFEGSNIRFTAKVSELGKEKALQQKADTYNMISSFADVIGMNALNYLEIKDAVKKKLGGEDGDTSHTSHSQQNN